MNRAVQRMHQRRCALKNNLQGGGLAVNPGASFVSDNGVPYVENQHYSDCYTQIRPGALQIQANPDLAQTPMAGGYNIMSAAQLASLTKKGGSRRQGCGLMRGGSRRQGCGLMRGGGCGCNWKLKGGQCGQPQRAWLGGKRRTRKMRGGIKSLYKANSLPYSRSSSKQSGGNKGGFEMAVAHNIGGDGPIAEPVRIPVPCDARAGMQNPFTATPVNPDPRTPMGYSLTPNTAQTGGQLSERVPNFEYSQTGAGYGGNAYDASCYRAPGSEMPVYPATSAGFHFTPSTEGGATLPDGITAFNEVVAHTARLGGSRKSRKSRKSTRRNRKTKRTCRKRVSCRH